MNQQKAYYLTRSSHFLWKLVFVSVFCFVLIGSALSWLNPAKEVDYTDLFNSIDYTDLSNTESLPSINQARFQEIILQELTRPTPFEDKLDIILGLSALVEDPDDAFLPKRTQLESLSDNEYSILNAFSIALTPPLNESDTDSDAHLQPLIQLTQETPVPPHAFYALGLYHYDFSNNKEAIAALKQEIAHSNLPAAKELLIDTYYIASQYETLLSLKEDPEYAPYIDSSLVQGIALEKMDWPVLVKTLLPAAYTNIQFSMLFLALLTGFIWSAFLFRLNFAQNQAAFILKCTLPALLLGALSAHLTILVIFLQEHQYSISFGETTLAQMIYCVAGIGLREEFLKLLCFVPFIPFLAKRNEPLTTLIVASLVGLGFAVEENINYFEMSQGSSTLGRFVTANFLHLSLTGLCGLSLVHAYRHRGYAINEAINTFLLAVLAHGLYDAFIMVPELVDYSILTFIIFILIVYRYFGTVRGLRIQWNQPISMTSQLTISLVTILGFAFIVLAWVVGPVSAGLLITSEVVSVGVILIVFYREIPENVG